MGKSLAFFDNYFVFAETLPPEQRLAFYDAVMRYAFRGEMPEDGSPAFAVFMLVRPSLDKSLAMGELGRRGGSARSAAKAESSRANGRRGGRPQRAETEAGKPNENPTETKRKPKRENPTETQRKPNENPTNKNENENIAFAIANAKNARTREAAQRETENAASDTPPDALKQDAPTLEDVLRVCRNDDCANPGGKSIPAEFGRWFFGTMEGMGWQQTNGRRVTRRNFRPFLFTWWRRADESEWAGASEGDGGEPSDAMRGALALAERARRMREDILADGNAKGVAE